MRVLLAEDNAIARTALAGRLRGQGFEVELAEDGEEALGQARKAHPDIVIADVLMPRMDGFSLCRALKSDPALNAIPVVFYSATFITPEDRQLAASVGASRFLQKSADVTELGTALREVLDEFEQARLEVPQQPLQQGEELDKFYESVLTRTLAAKVNELEEEKRALHQSEQRYHRLVATIPDVIFVLSLPEFNTTYIAPEAERLIGVSGEAVLGDASRWLALVHEGDRARLMQELSAAVAQKRGLNSVFRMYHKEGGIRWLEWHGSFVVDEEGTPIEMLGVLTDITERKIAEEKLVQSERRLANLFSNLPGMAYRCRNTPQWVMEFVSDGAQGVTGYRQDELAGSGAIAYSDLIHPDDRQRVWEEVQQALAQGEQFSLAYRFRHKDGSLRWLWERGVGVVDSDTGELWVEGFINDITQRKQAEEKISDLARFPEENPSPVLRINAGGEIVYANPASRGLLHECREQSDNTFCGDIVASARSALQSGNLERFEYHAADKYYSFVVAPVVDAGYANLYGREITRRVLAARQLERLNRVLRTLSKGNRTLVHADSEEELLKSVCQVLAEEGDYPFVWIAFTEAPPTLQLQVQCGEHRERLQPWLAQLMDSTWALGQVDAVLREKRPLLVGDLQEGGWGMTQTEALTAAGLSTLLLLPLAYKSRHFGVLGIFSSSQEVFDEQEMDLLNEMAGDVAYGIQALRTDIAHEKGMERIQKTMLQTIEAVSLTLEKRDPYTAGHQQRVEQLAVSIAREMGLTAERVEGLRLGALVHDLGKIYVPAEILNRPGRLTESEFGIIKSHPEVGYDILKGVEFDWPIAEMVLQHHERYDGSGYPHGLKEEEIMPEARILAVADVVEAITSHRPYRPGLGLEVALQEIESGRGTRYDPLVADTCLKLFREKGFVWEPR